MLDWMRSVEKIPSIPGILTGLIVMAKHLHIELGEGAVMVELGSFAGESTEVFAREIAVVHAVDPWQDACGATSAKEVEDSFDERAKRAGNVTKHKMTSDEALDLFPDGTLDFVYVDAGAHSYAENYRDVSHWWPKVRQGGFMGGHDWEIPELHAADTFPGVQASVRDFFGGNPEKLGLIVFPDTSWLVRKP